MLQVHVEGDIGTLYKVRVGFHGGDYDVPWFGNYNLAPSWFLETVSIDVKKEYLSSIPCLKCKYFMCVCILEMYALFQILTSENSKVFVVMYDFPPMKIQELVSTNFSLKEDNPN